jgi:hypothetical protein
VSAAAGEMPNLATSHLPAIERGPAGVTMMAGMRMM